jgi:hypothetical protein
VNKLQYSMGAAPRQQDANWNQRPRDAANLAKFITRQTERRMNWQIISFEASLDEFLDSPILYISGNQAVIFSPDQLAKLREFIENGGLIVANADNSTPAFANAFKRQMSDLFKYEFRTLPADHIIYTGEQFNASRWRRKPVVLGMSNGVREMVLLLQDGDPARYWHAYDIGTRPELFEMMADVFQYAIDKQNTRFKGDTYLVKPDDSIKADKTIKLARVQYPGNWNPEPAGWKRVAAILHNNHKVDLTAEQVDIEKLDASDAKIAHLTGVGVVKFNEAARKSLKAFVEKGGLLLVDAAGGSSPFGHAVETEFDAIFGEDAAALKQALPPDHAVYGAGNAKAKIYYRDFARRTITGQLEVGRLRGMLRNGKLAVVYSRRWTELSDIPRKRRRV